MTHITKTIKLKDVYYESCVQKRKAINKYKLNMVKQKLCGVLLLLITAILTLVNSGTNGHDITFAFLFVLMGIYAIFSKTLIMK